LLAALQADPLFDPASFNIAGYSFRLAALNGVAPTADLANFSEAVVIDVAGGFTLDSATAGETSIDLAWTDPATATSAPTTGYALRYRATGSNTWIYFSDPIVDAGVTVDGLAGVTEYEFQVAAINAAGQGAFGDSFYAATVASAADAVSIDDTSATGTSVTLNWTAPDAHFAPITGYAVQYRATGSDVWIVGNQLAAGATSWTVTGLSVATEYEFQIVALNSVGNTIDSANVMDPAVVSTATYATAPAFDSSIATLTSILVSWLEVDDNGGTDVTGYKIAYRETGAANWIYATQGLALNHLFTGLKNDTEYEFQVAAITGVGVGAWSDSSYVRTGKPAVTTVIAPVVTTYTTVTTEANAAPVSATVTVPTNSGVNNNASVQVISNPTAVSLIDAGAAGAVTVNAAVNSVVQLTSTLFAATDVVQAYLQTPDGTWIDLGQGAVNADGTLALPALKLTKAGAYNIVFTLVGQVQTAGVTPRYGSLTQSTLIKVGSVKPAKTTVLFGRDSAVLTKAVQAAIKAWVKVVGKSRVVYVDGYANGINYKTGKADKSAKAIAKARAAAVAKFLKSLGLNVVATGRAATAPVNKKVVSLNRRAVLSVK